MKFEVESEFEETEKEDMHEAQSDSASMCMDTQIVRVGVCRGLRGR